MAELLSLKDNAILSPRGSVSVDERTNTLLVKDTNSSLANVRNLLTELDIPVRQVLIESRVVIANDDFSKELGVRFGVSRDSQGTTQAGDAAYTSGTLSGIENLANDETLLQNNRLLVDPWLLPLLPLLDLNLSQSMPDCGVSLSAS